MSIKPDHWIRRMALEHGMIEPFVDGQMREGVISYGISNHGNGMLHVNILWRMHKLLTKQAV